MIALTVNGAEREVPDGATVVDLVADVTGRDLTAEGTPADGGRLGVAVALDAAVVPRSRWGRTPLAPGQQVDLITAMQGG